MWVQNKIHIPSGVGIKDSLKNEQVIYLHQED